MTEELRKRLREAKPKAYYQGLLFDSRRIFLDPEAIGYWIAYHFPHVTKENFMERVGEPDEMNERIEIDGDDYRIPDACYDKSFTGDAMP